jgi:hypothetical protein
MPLKIFYWVNERYVGRFCDRESSQSVLSKQQDWVDHNESAKWVRYEYHDDALNALVEMSVKDPGLRARVQQIDPT